MLNIDFQIACENEDNIPDIDLFSKWINKALIMEGYLKENEDKDIDITVRIVDEDEIQDLNRTYRNKDKTTNILSFPFECPDEVSIPLLGDLVLCKNVVEKEALEQEKTLEEHYAHLIVHGTLHLLGYDHIEDEDAKIMEPLEIKIVMALNYANPYKDEI